MDKKLQIPVVLMFLIVILTGAFYHNGFQANCPFCVSGSYNLKFIKHGDLKITAKDRIAHFIWKIISHITTFIPKTVFSTRAPPV